MANQFLALSLFIMLLSFFIILNALSSYEETKAKPVLNSLSMTFSNNATVEILSPNVVEAPEHETNEGDTLSKLESLFNAHITGVEVTKNSLGTTMRVRMPFARFESSLMEPVRDGDPSEQRLGAAGTFLPTLVSLVQTRETGLPYRMDMVLNVEGRPAKLVREKPASFRRNLQKIALVAKKLEVNGLEKKLVSSGLADGEENMVDVYFAPYVPVNPVQEREL